MKFLLDTNAVIDYLRGHPLLVEAIGSAAGITISAIVAAEFYIGYHAVLPSATKATKDEVKALFRNYPVLRFDTEDAYELTFLGVITN
ncbi:PIN domain-containing protein [Pseudoduganella sp. FT55W]|uniref:PIN domain-containing protein n=1 Tax=Duganella rivi TaxID=2666083 RepID=A0A7X4KAZ4_9BURK|nr:type II toxin-antitoxin system VapC family toxin [Duganella rivi]MYM66625.1 PIN domain-containing protein [Duganella rivi]